MHELRLERRVYKSALKRCQLSSEEYESLRKLIGDGSGTTGIKISMSEFPEPYLRALLGEGALNATQRATISMKVYGVRGDREDYDRIYDTTVSSPIEFASAFSALGVQSPNCEFLINGRWYPISVGAVCTQDEARFISSVSLQGVLSIGDIQESVYLLVRRHFFLTDDGESQEHTVRDILNSVGLRPLTESNVDHNLKLLNAERKSRETGAMVWIKGPVLIRSEFSWWQRTESRALGTEASPRKGIIEPELEANENSADYYNPSRSENPSRLPFVRVFSLDTKSYVYADIEDVAEYEFDEGAIDRLHLPAHMINILSTVFTAPSETIFGDVIAGKHGGLVMLASGRPGVGKTLTAEVYSEVTNRPLYVMELGELGTTADQVEEMLNRVFTRIARWNAVLQFDECEIFLAERGNDLERSAIVGIFLRLLDYYRGILFLTTNRPEVIDEAIRSRVTIQLEYPDLDRTTRISIWQTMFKVAELNVDDEVYERISAFELNGRQIRNVVRLAKIVYGSQKLCDELIVKLIRISIPDATEEGEEFDTKQTDMKRQPQEKTVPIDNSKGLPFIEQEESVNNSVR